ncbi:MAG: hypothetical protein GIW99_06220, partial [Candidatus Eremiobacteraeota bacterium]|nr:hypothetical protein [Candidatus Eremiobacteraeota bacterium]
MMILLATLFLSVGLINLDFTKDWWRGQRLRLAIGLPIVFVYCYETMPPLVFPQALSLLLLTFVPNAVYSLMDAARSAVTIRALRIVSRRRMPALPYVIGAVALGLWLLILIIAPVVDANGLRDLAGAQITSAPPPAAKPQHLRIVPQVSAAFEGDKVVGQLGSYYEIDADKYNIQPVNGQLQWVAPLQFRDFIKWVTRGTTPGVVEVSAEKPDQAARLLLGEPMRYVPSAFLWADLKRHVYSAYGYRQILELTLQLDDKEKPMYLATLGRPTIGWSGEVVTGVVIVDPVTGAMQNYAREDFARLPGWVKRVYPPELVWQYNEWFGLYVHGWLNARLSQRDVHLPARGEVFGVIDPAKQFAWFCDHTSPSANDRSMTGYTYTDTVTGKMTYYTGFNGYFNSQAADTSVGAFPTVRQAQLIPQQPVLYNLFARPTWIVPTVADNGKYQTLGLVLADGGHTIVGSVNASNPEADAVAQLQAFVAARASPGRNGGNADAGAVSRNGIVDRVAVVGDSLYVTLRGDRRIYRIELSAPNAALTRAGDRATVTFVGGKAGVPL